jgi:hypothetical protein
MAGINFATALKDPDDNASNLRLHQLILARDYNSDRLPSVAEDYLHAFLNTTLSHLRRRWLGIVLVGMMDASPEVVEHLKTEEQPLQGLGDIILSRTEREETKIIAGFVMRQALELHIEFASFWTSDKVKSSAPNFPQITHPKWMSNFQSFLDTLSELALANSTTDPCLLYPVSLVASDGFQWVAADNGMPITIIEQDLLTVLLPDLALRAVQFLDVPIAHIQSTKTRQAPLHDSQSRIVDHAPCELILTLKPGSSGYRLNASTRAATELSILFAQSSDAIECESVIEEIRQGKTYSAKISAHRTRQPSTSRLHSNPSPTPPETSGITLSRSLRGKMQPPRPLLDRREKQNSDEVTQIVGCVQPVRKPLNTNPTPDLAQTKALQNQHNLQHLTDETHVGSSRTTKVRKQIRSAQIPDEPDELTDCTTSAAKGRITYSNGKLPKASRVVKKLASQQPRKLDDIFDIPKDNKKSKQRKQASSELSSDEGSTLNPKLSKTTIASQTTRSRRRTKDNDDDEFRPGKPTKKVGPKRKSISEPATQDKASKRNTTTEPKASAAVTLNRKVLSTRVKAQQVQRGEASSEVQAQPSSSKSPGKSRLSATISRSSLIGGLLGSQQPSPIAQPTFKMPALPCRAPQAPSTPTQLRTPSALPAARPRTPTEQRRPPRTPIAFIQSSPLSKIRVDEGFSRSRNTGDTEIMSSNSKPVPASPHAESTAISGHADRDDVDLEKQAGDVQTAKLDPFLQRRREGQKPTSFYRRLTGDNLVIDNPVADKGLSQESPLMIASSESLGMDDTLVMTASQLLPLPRADDGKGSNPAVDKATVSQPLVQNPKFRPTAIQTTAVIAKYIEVSDREAKPSTVQSSQSLKRKAVADAVDSSDGVRKRPTIVQGLTSFVERSPSKHTTIVPEAEKLATYVDDSIQSAPQQIVDDTRSEKKATPVREAIESATYINHAIRPEQIVDDTQSEKKTTRVREAQKSATRINYSVPHQQAMDDTQPELTVEDQDDFDTEGHTLLDNDDSNDDTNPDSEEQLPTYKATPIHFRSSPPLPGTPSSHSSTSASPDSSPTPPLPPFDHEEMEWEASLQPHQRSLHDSLMRVSKRVLRHVVDNETAVTDIADVYETDGEQVLQEVLARQNGACAELWRDMGAKKKRLQEDMESSVEVLVRERKRVGSIV